MKPVASRAVWIGGTATLLVVGYVLSSGPARAIWPAVRWRGGSQQFRIETGIKPGYYWAEPVASFYAPLCHSKQDSVPGALLIRYWKLFDRDNFYHSDCANPSDALKYSWCGTRIRQFLGLTD